MLGGAYSCNRLQGRTLNVRSTRKVPKSQTSPYPKIKEKKMLDENGIPIPVTSNNWKPIEAFDFGADYAAEPFLVWFEDGIWSEAWIEDGKFVGEWRYVVDGPGGTPVVGVVDKEPIAFKLVDGPDLDRLKRIVETYYKKAA